MKIFTIKQNEKEKSVFLFLNIYSNNMKFDLIICVVFIYINIRKNFFIETKKIYFFDFSTKFFITTYWSETYSFFH